MQGEGVGEGGGVERGREWEGEREGEGAREQASNREIKPATHACMIHLQNMSQTIPRFR